ncbi:hypothetical protein V2W45_1524043 [Cenococcum geophilum]
MAPSALPFEPSYTALKSLRQKVSNYTTTSVTLPHRPKNLSTDLHPYLDNAIVTLSTSTAYLYDDNAPWAVRVVEVKKGVERVDTKVDEVKAEVAEVNKKVDEVDKKVDEVDKKNSLFNQTQSLNNHTYIQLNFIQKWLDDQIEPITAYKRWKRATLRDTNVSCYMELEDIVTAHPYKCLGKRKAETDNGLRRVRAREDQDNDSVTGSELTSSQNPSRVISRRDLVELLIAAKREDLGRRSPKIRSTSSIKRRRNRMRYSDVSSLEPTQPFFSEELRQLAPGLGPT